MNLARVAIRLAGLIAALELVGCSGRAAAPAAAPIISAKLGVFFGDQVQQRDEIPFSVDPASGRHGFRVDFGERLRRTVEVAWEITRPEASRAPVRRSRTKTPVVVAPPPPTVERGQASAEPGEARFDRVFAFHPGDPLGTYNYRVLVDRRLVIDRSVNVFDPADPARAALDDFE